MIGKMYAINMTTTERGSSCVIWIVQNFNSPVFTVHESSYEQLVEYCFLLFTVVNCCDCVKRVELVFTRCTNV